MLARCKILFALLTSLLLIHFNSTAQSRIPGQFIIHLHHESSVHQVLKNFIGYRPEIRLLSKSWNIWLLKFPQGDDDELLQTIREIPAVQFAQFNHHVQPRSVTPNDTLFPNQWNLENTGQSNGRPGADISATEAWELNTSGVTVTGDTIVIAVIDEGFYLAHTDLRFWKNRLDVHNGIDDDLNGYIDDFHGWNVGAHTDSIPDDSHGTHVAGIAAATGNNITGVTGVAWNARLMPVSIPDYQEAQVVEAYSYIFEMRKLYNTTFGQKGSFVVATNSSFGWDFGQPEDYPIWCAMYDSLGKVGILSAASTANITYDVEISGDIPSLCISNHLIIATNTTRFDTKNTTAAFGKFSVDLGAPGTAIYSTAPFNNYNYQSGTSMSAAHVAGAVAMMYSVACEDFLQAYISRPDSLSLIMKDYILKGTDILHDLDGLTVSGGRLNLYNSMNMLLNDFCVTCLQINESISNVSCHGGADGSISLTVSEGLAPYHYEWSTTDTAASQSNLPRGKYLVKVTDSSGCVKFRYFEITQPDNLIVNIASDSAVNGENGSAQAFVTGGSPPYSYLWDDPLQSTTATVYGLTPGIYTVTVTDANGCQSLQSVTVGNIIGIDSPRKIELHVFPNPTGALIRLNLNFFQQETIQVLLTDAIGKKAMEKTFAPTEKNPVLDLSPLKSGVYFLKATGGDSVGLEKIIKL